MRDVREIVCGVKLSHTSVKSYYTNMKWILITVSVTYTTQISLSTVLQE